MNKTKNTTKRKATTQENDDPLLVKYTTTYSNEKYKRYRDVGKLIADVFLHKYVEDSESPYMDNLPQSMQRLILKLFGNHKDDETFFNCLNSASHWIEKAYKEFKKTHKNVTFDEFIYEED